MLSESLQVNGAVLHGDIDRSGAVGWRSDVAGDLSVSDLAIEVALDTRHIELTIHDRGHGSIADVTNLQGSLQVKKYFHDCSVTIKRPTSPPCDFGYTSSIGIKRSLR